MRGAGLARVNSAKKKLLPLIYRYYKTKQYAFMNSYTRVCGAELARVLLCFISTDAAGI